MAATTNLGMKIWGALEHFLRTEMNDNFTKIDTAVGNPSNLNTTEKTELVGAVNEVRSNLIDHQADYVQYVADKKYLDLRGCRYIG